MWKYRSNIKWYKKFKLKINAVAFIGLTEYAGSFSSQNSLFTFKRFKVGATIRLDWTNLMVKKFPPPKWLRLFELEQNNKKKLQKWQRDFQGRRRKCEDFIAETQTQRFYTFWANSCSRAAITAFSIKLSFGLWLAIFSSLCVSRKEIAFVGKGRVRLLVKIPDAKISNEKNPESKR